MLCWSYKLCIIAIETRVYLNILVIKVPILKEGGYDTSGWDMKLLWVVVVTQWVVAPVKDMNQKLIVFIVNAIYITTDLR